MREQTSYDNSKNGGLLSFIIYVSMWISMAFIPMMRAPFHIGGLEYAFGIVLLITVIYIFYLITKCRNATDQKTFYRWLAFLAFVPPLATFVMMMSQIQC